MAYSGNPKEYSVAVLYGGTSGERPVSLNSGSSCAKALEGLGFKVTLIDTADTQDLSRLITDEFDVAFIALHGRGGEDGTIQGFLETLGIPYTGSGILASAQAINKSKTKELYAQAGLPVADSVTVGKGDPLNDDDLAGIMDEIGIPCVVKPATEGSSLGMTIVKDPADMRGAIDTALGVDDEAMVEQFIEGLELTVGVMGNDEPQALPVIQIVPTEDEFYNFHAKYAAGGSTHLCPAPISAELTEQLQNLAGCKGVTRTDILVKDDGSCWILETNTLPGMTGTSLVPDAARAIGIEFPELCEKIVAMALE